MPERSSRIRFWITASLLAGATILLHAANRPIKVPAGHPLKELPLSLGDWQGIDMPLTDHILAAAGVDDYLNRSYTNADRAGIEVYVGYYSSQKSGELIHSPKNCLPAAGWEWVRKGRIDVQLPDHGTLRINDFRISKSIYKDLVLYWYQGRGRVIADEYQAKLWLIADAFRSHRTDGSIVRIVVPIQNTEADARALGIDFLRVFYPKLVQFIPN